MIRLVQTHKTVKNSRQSSWPFGYHCSLCEKFSLHSNIHWNKCNRLTNEHDKRLVFVNHNLKFLEPNKLPRSEVAKPSFTGGFKGLTRFHPSSLQPAIQRSQAHPQTSSPAPIQSSTPMNNLALENANESSDSKQNSIVSSNIL